MNYYNFDLEKEVIFNYSETPLLKEHFLHKFLIEFKIEKFSVIKTASTQLNLEEIEDQQKVVIHDLNNDEFYKIYVGLSKDAWQVNDKFFSQAYFSNNIITTYLSDNRWIIKSTRVPGEDIYNFLWDESKMIFTMDDFLDSMLLILKWFSDEGKRIWEDNRPPNKYLSIGEVNWVSINNMFYCPDKKIFTKVDHEPRINWVDKQTYMNDAIRSFIELFGNLMKLRAHNHIMNYIADGKNILKRIEYCIDFVENEIFD